MQLIFILQLITNTHITITIHVDEVRSALCGFKVPAKHLEVKICPVILDDVIYRISCDINKGL